MNKQLWIIIAVIIILAGFGYFAFYKTPSNSQPASTQINPTTTPSSTNTQPALSFKGFLQGETVLSKGQAFTSTPTKEVVSLQIVNGPQSINPTFDALVNGKLAETAYPTGEPSEPVVGVAAAMSSFSPDNKYFAFRSRVDQGAGL